MMARYPQEANLYARIPLGGRAPVDRPSRGGLFYSEGLTLTNNDDYHHPTKPIDFVEIVHLITPNCATSPVKSDVPVWAI